MTNPNEKQSATSDIWETKLQQQQKKLKKNNNKKNMSVLFQISFPYGFSEAVYEVRKERKTKRRLTGKQFRLTTLGCRVAANICPRGAMYFCHQSAADVVGVRRIFHRGNGDFSCGFFCRLSVFPPNRSHLEIEARPALTPNA